MPLPSQAASNPDPEQPLEKVINQQLASPQLDVVLAPFSNAGVVTVTPLLFAAPHGIGAVGRVGLAELASLGAFEGLKVLVQRPRPFVADPSTRLPFGPESEWSFPSGHTTVAFASATILANEYPGWGPLFYSLSGLVALSRMYGGLHYPSDTLGGAILGFSVAEGVMAADRWLADTYHLRPSGGVSSAGWSLGSSWSF